MILRELYLGSGRAVKFEIGLNIILGKNRNPISDIGSTKTTDNNGIGKTTIIRIISHILGGPAEGSIESQFFNEGKRWGSLHITSDHTDYVVARPLWKPLSDQAVILFEGGMLSFNSLLREKGVFLNSVDDIGFLNNRLNSVQGIRVLEKNEAQNFITRIEQIDYSQSNLKFSALLDFIIRDEKLGFSNIISRAMRKEWTQYRSIQYLFGLPAFIEEAASKLKKEELQYRTIAKSATEYLKEQGVGDISAIQNEEVKATQKLKSVREDLEKLNVTTSFDDLQSRYNKTKTDFVNINSELSLKNSQLKNFSANLKDLKDKEIAISSFINVDEFYEELIGVFPESVSMNFEAYQEFFSSVSEDRKGYYSRLIKGIRREVRELNASRNTISQQLNDLSRNLEGTSIVSDISGLVKLEERYENSLRKLARAKEKLAELESSIDIADEKKADRDAVLKNGKAQEKSSRSKRQSLIKLFHDLVEDVYSKEDGTISFDYVSESSSSIAGRTKIDAKIPSDKSKGRTYAKICLFDFVWFLKAKHTDEYNPEFLIHDGPFSGISTEPKKNMLKLIGARSKSLSKQYIITANADELPDDLSEVDFHIAITLDGSSVQGKLYGEQYE